MSTLSPKPLDLFARAPAGARIPVVLVTGFLGSGKTTLLREMLRRESLRDSVAIVNELGEVALDHALLETPAERTVPLGSGCVCCTLRGDLQETLADLLRRRRIGAIADFERVFVETTGLADPGPVIQTFAADAELARRYRLARVCTVVDAANALTQLESFSEARRQVALADTLVLTKCDLADASLQRSVRERLRLLNPHAALWEAVHGAVNPAALLGETDEVASATPAEPGEAGPHSEISASEPHSDISTFVLRVAEPFPAPAVAAFFETLAKLRGPDLLRVKGLLRVAGEERPLAVHGVHHVFHPPRFLARWPDDSRESRIVFIVQGIEKRAVEGLLRGFLEPGLYSGG